MIFSWPFKYESKNCPKRREISKCHEKWDLVAHFKPLWALYPLGTQSLGSFAISSGSVSSLVSRLLNANLIRLFIAALAAASQRNASRVVVSLSWNEFQSKQAWLKFNERQSWGSFTMLEETKCIEMKGWRHARKTIQIRRKWRPKLKFTSAPSVHF